MDPRRRDLFRKVGGASLAAALPGPLLGQGRGQALSGPSKDGALDGGFRFEDGVTHLNAAFTHPMAPEGHAALAAFSHARRHAADGVGPHRNARDAAVAAFAGLIHAEPGEVAVLPSTLDAENMLGAALDIAGSAGVVTDALHYEASLAMYGELSQRGMPLTVVAPAPGSGVVGMDELEAAIAAQRPRLVAVSLVSSSTGFMHDLEAVCALAHAHGALVYADVIQAAGAVPIDVRASGVDFCACGGYKRLMGDFGAAFLYVRADRLPLLRRVFVGWRQVRKQTRHVLPHEPPGSALGEWELRSDTAGIFEVSTPAWGTLAVLEASIGYIRRLGVDAIVRHRQPLIDRLQAELPGHGFVALTPEGSASPIVSFAYEGAAAKFGDALKAKGIRISTYPDRIRVAPSVYNTMDEVETLIEVLAG